jgi:hypothetical protein
MLHKRPGQQFSAAIGVSLAAGLSVWLLLLLSAGPSQASRTYITLGHLKLHTITRQETSEGLAVGITFEKGLLVYIALWLLIGAAAGVVMAMISRHRKG